MKYVAKIYLDNNSFSFFMGDNFHRANGPAVNGDSGNKYWMQNNEYHRLDGPAIEHSNGAKEWFQYGKSCRQAWRARHAGMRPNRQGRGQGRCYPWLISSEHLPPWAACPHLANKTSRSVDIG